MLDSVTETFASCECGSVYVRAGELTSMEFGAGGAFPESWARCSGCGDRVAFGMSQ